MESITSFFIVRKILGFFLSDSIQGKSSWFFLHKPPLPDIVSSKAMDYYM